MKCAKAIHLKQNYDKDVANCYSDKRLVLTYASAYLLHLI